MLMGHPPQRIPWGREHVPQGCFEGLTPVPVPMGVQALGASDSAGQEALADTLEAVQEMAQAGPPTFPHVTGHPRAVRSTTSRLARTMGDRTRIRVGLGAMGARVCIGAALRPALPLGNAARGARRGADILSYCQRDWRGGRVLVGLITALHQAQPG